MALENVHSDSHDINSGSIQELGRNFDKNMFCQASLKQPSRYKDMYLYMPGTQSSIHFQPTTSSNLSPNTLIQGPNFQKKTSNLEPANGKHRHPHYHHHLLQTFHRIQKVLLLTGFQVTKQAIADRFTGHW